MPRNRLTTVLAGAVLALAFGTAAASAATAYASATVNVRAGAGTGYAVVDVLRRGEAVDIDYCRGSWCLVRKPGVDGWVSANYLSADRGYDDRYDRPRVVVRPPAYYRPWRPYYRPYVRPYGGFYGGPYFNSSVCAGGPNLSFCFGG